jgi:hypothetical protein
MGISFSSIALDIQPHSADLVFQAVWSLGHDYKQVAKISIEEINHGFHR